VSTSVLRHLELRSEVDAVTKTCWQTGQLDGDVVRSERVVGDLLPLWQDQDSAMQQKAEVVYETQSWLCRPDGTEGAVLWASTKIYSGSVGGEHFMTRGHFHTKPTHGELIIVASGIGVLLLMDRERNCQQLQLSPGVTYYIDGTLAHRTVNTGREPLIFWCSWPADCGHDYTSIEQDGFAERIFLSSV
jgi:glucose-6-phosphate isomerase, archaeal